MPSTRAYRKRRLRAKRTRRRFYKRRRGTRKIARVAARVFKKMNGNIKYYDYTILDNAQVPSAGILADIAGPAILASGDGRSQILNDYRFKLLGVKVWVYLAGSNALDFGSTRITVFRKKQNSDETDPVAGFINTITPMDISKYKTYHDRRWFNITSSVTSAGGSVQKWDEYYVPINKWITKAINANRFPSIFMHIVGQAGNGQNVNGSIRLRIIWREEN